MNIKWFKENAKLGKRLGFPDCCVLQFCQESPEVLKKRGRNKADVERYKAGFVNGKFSGFIPCTKHTKQIMKGEIKLADLIKNREKSFPPFPEAFQY